MAIQPKQYLCPNIKLVWSTVCSFKADCQSSTCSCRASCRWLFEATFVSKQVPEKQARFDGILRKLFGKFSTRKTDLPSNLQIFFEETDLKLEKWLGLSELGYCKISDGNTTNGKNKRPLTEDVWDYENGFLWYSDLARLNKLLAQYELYKRI